MAATRDEISAFVQNRCFAHLVWGSRRADFCEQRGIVYQGFSLLTANQEVLRHPPLIAVARELNALQPSWYLLSHVRLCNGSHSFPLTF
jgi:diketogulonate reductase-like aldo/keto reductase